MNSLAKATEVEPGNAGGTASVRHNNDRAGVASRSSRGLECPGTISRSGRAEAARQPHKLEVEGASPSPATNFVSCVRKPFLGVSSLNFGRRLPTQRAGLFRDGVAGDANAISCSARPVGDLPARGCSFSFAGATVPRGRAPIEVKARPHLRFLRHLLFAPCVSVFHVVADKEHGMGAFCAERKRFFLFA